DCEHELVAGPDDAAEPNILHSAEEWQRTRVARIAEHGYRTGLGQRLELQDAGKDRIAGKVSGEEVFVAPNPIARPSGDTRFVRIDGVDESKRRSVRQERNEIARVGHAS